MLFKKLGVLYGKCFFCQKIILAYKIIKSYLKYFCALGLRWGHPGQQQGLFFHFKRSLHKRVICSSLVSCFFTMVTQQIHSLRAKSVRWFHFSSTSGFEFKIFFKSSGSSWRKSLVISWLIQRKNME